jgi:CheY-like chemotaxis protein
VSASMAKKILIADDHAPTRALIRSILATGGEDFAISEADGGRDCLERVSAEGPFDLVLLDVAMPDLDGYSVCREIRKAHPRLPVVFVTAKGDLKDVAAGREAGGDSYIVKPIARAALRSIVGLFTSIPRARA